MKNFEIFLNRLDWLGNWISQFIRFFFQEYQSGHLAFFRSVFPHLESKSYTVAFLGFLPCEECSEKFWDFFSISLTGWGTGSTSSLGFFFHG